jgi:RNA recognition motif-containing protein
MDRETGNSKCFGFVEMDDDNEANQCIAELNESMFEGKEIVVKKANPRESRGNSFGGRNRY